jgi:hypothetical protein
MSNKAIIGTLKEKTLHAALKHYFEPDETLHEIKIGGFVADIYDCEKNEIIEIQTRSFEKLRKKLSHFLEIADVTVVFPIARTKWLIWVDEKTGEAKPKRKSPKKGSIYDCFYELYKIKAFLNHPNFALCLVLVDLEETRFLNGWSKDKKKGSTRCDRIPVEIAEEICFKKTQDYLKFIPEISQNLPEKFTTRDYAKSVKTHLSNSQTALNILHHIGAVDRVGKSGNMYLYTRNMSGEV